MLGWPSNAVQWRLSRTAPGDVGGSVQIFREQLEWRGDPIQRKLLVRLGRVPSDP